jgi:hypothetical protein
MPAACVGQHVKSRSAKREDSLAVFALQQINLLLKPRLPSHKDCQASTLHVLLQKIKPHNTCCNAPKTANIASSGLPKRSYN